MHVGGIQITAAIKVQLLNVEGLVGDGLAAIISSAQICESIDMLSVFSRALGSLVIAGTFYAVNAYDNSRYDNVSHLWSRLAACLARH